MIKINLLPKDVQRQEKEKKTFELSLVGVVFVIVLLFIAGIASKLSLVRLEKELATTNAKLEEVSALVGVVEQKQKQKEVLDRKWGIIKKLLEGRFRWAMIMDEMVASMPKTVWLTSLRGTKNDLGNMLSIDGVGFDNFAIADFITQLEDNDYFENAELGGINDLGVEKTGASKLSFSVTLNSKL